jgi:class 3 adenylate cyclase/predicted ATPase
VDVAAWLRELGLERYEQAFRDNDIDAAVLPELTADDLIGLGVTSIGHRRKMLAAIARLHAAEASEARTSAYDEAPQHSDAERRQLTVLFCDLVGSTELAARLDPEDMGQVIRAYHSTCTEVIERWEGHVAKYMGDGVLAYFGWPRAHEDDAERAVRAGLATIDALSGVETSAGKALAARIGIATGLVMVGELIGQGGAQEQTVVGETPNLAARLQALAEPGIVVISQRTRRLVGGLFELGDLGPQRLKGFAEPVRAFRVEGEGRAEGRFEALHGQHLTPLVGREHELGILLERWAWAKDGDGQVMLLSGEPGIGKSRIVQALREQVRADRPAVLNHYCSPYHRNSALHPVIAQLERAAGVGSDDPSSTRLDRLEALLAPLVAADHEAVPLIAALLSIPTGGRYPALTLSPQRQMQRTMEVLVACLAGAARDRPVLVLYEDVHWIDPTTQALLGLLVERVAHLPALMVITFRPEFTPPWIGHAHVTSLLLSRLSQRQGAAMVARVIGDKTLPPEVLEQIVARTDGVPLFVEELTKTVLESGLLRDAGDHWELEGPLPALAIPSTLQDSLMARLDRLAPVKEVAQVGAAIGRQFSHDLLAAVSPLDEGRLQGALDQLVDAELVFRRGLPPDAIYTFKHALVQDAAYQSLLKSTRAELHRRIAGALEAHFPTIVEGQPETVAHHYAEAGLPDAAAYWLRAGELAAGRYAHLEAVAHLRRGLGLLGDIADEAKRNRFEIDLQAALGVSLLATKGFAAPETGEAYSRAEQLCGASGETSRLYAIRQGLWNHHLVRGDVELARQLAERSLAAAEDEGDPEHLLAAHHALVGTYLLGTFEKAHHHFEQAWRIGQQMPTRSLTSLIGADLRVFMRAYGCHALWHLGFPDQATRMAEEALSISRTAADSFSWAIALCYAAMLQQFACDPAAVRELAAESIDLCRKHHFAYYLAWAQIIHGWAESALGRPIDGIAEIERGLADIDATGGRLRHAYYLSLLADAHGRADDSERGLAFLEQAIELTGRTGEHWRDADLHRLKGVLSLSLDRAAEAEACFQRALMIAREQGAKALELKAALDLARLWRDRGKWADARDLVAPVYGWFTEGFDTKDLKEAEALLDELR